MKIISWNVNGLRSILTKTLPALLDEYAPDVLCLQETRMNGAVEGDVDIPFKHKFYSHADKKGYSGTAVFSNVEPSKGGAVDFAGHVNEGRVVVADIAGLNVVSSYVPNSRDELARLDYRMKWDADFREFLKPMKNLVVCGDFNVAHNEIDIAFPAENRGCAGFSDEERADFSKLLSEVPLRDFWRDANPAARDQYTWWSYRNGARRRNHGWRIDYILVSPCLCGRVKDAALLQKIGGSDHCPVLIEIDTNNL